MADTKVTKKLESEQQAIVRTTNSDLVCKDCLLKLDDTEIFGNTSKCEAYPVCKPIQVLRGGECDERIKE